MGLNANIYSAVASRQDQRKQQRDLKKQRDEELSLQGYDRDVSGNLQIRPDSSADAQQLQIEEAVALGRANERERAASLTDEGLIAYGQSGDADDLQRVSDNNPAVKQTLLQRGINFISNIDFTNDEKLLRTGGFVPTSYDTEEKRDIIKRSAYKVHDGKNWTIGLANKAAAEVGTGRRKGSRATQPIRDNHKKLVDLLGGTKSSPNTSSGHKYESAINSAAEKYDVPANLIASMMNVESSNNPNAVSPKGAGGLMQIMPATAKDLGLEDVFNPEKNIEAGAKYMSQLLDRYDGDVELALAAYNGGMGNVDKYGGIPPFAETQSYVERITGNADAGESFSGSDFKKMQDVILNQRRRAALASQGKTVASEDAAAKLASRKVGQKDRELAAKEEVNRLKASEEDTKISTVRRKLNEADDVREDIYKPFGSEQDFMVFDFKIGSPEHNQALKKVVELENLTDTKLSSSMQDKISSIGRVIAIADPAIQLSDKDTGLIDNQVSKFKKFFSNDVKGVAARGAYSTFRNSIRHALFGSALTAPEIASFEEAFGTLGNQRAPVLEQFKIALLQVQSDLSRASQSMLPAAAKIRLGVDQKKMIAIQSALQERIDYMQGLVDNPKGDRKASSAKSSQNILNAFSGGGTK